MGKHANATRRFRDEWLQDQKLKGMCYMYRGFVVMLVLDDRIVFMNISGRAGSFVSILTQAIHGLFYDVVKRTTEFIIWPSCMKSLPQWFYFFLNRACAFKRLRRSGGFLCFYIDTVHSWLVLRCHKANDRIYYLAKLHKMIATVVLFFLNRACVFITFS